MECAAESVHAWVLPARAKGHTDRLEEIEAVTCAGVRWVTFAIPGVQEGRQIAGTMHAQRVDACAKQGTSESYWSKAA